MKLLKDVTKELDFVQLNTLDTIKHTEIKESELDGFGLFSTQTIEKDTILCILDGQVIKAEKYENLIKNISTKVSVFKNYFFMECNKLDINTYLVRPYRTKYSYINHSFSPNTILRKYPLRLVSLQKIIRGEELTIDYTQEDLSQKYLSLDNKRFLKKDD